jgi:hypothetical protein
MTFSYYKKNFNTLQLSPFSFLSNKFEKLFRLTLNYSFVAKQHITQLQLMIVKVFVVLVCSSSCKIFFFVCFVFFLFWQTKATVCEFTLNNSHALVRCRRPRNQSRVTTAVCLWSEWDSKGISVTPVESKSMRRTST